LSFHRGFLFFCISFTLYLSYIYISGSIIIGMVCFSSVNADLIDNVGFLLDRIPPVWILMNHTSKVVQQFSRFIGRFSIHQLITELTCPAKITYIYFEETTKRLK